MPGFLDFFRRITGGGTAEADAEAVDDVSVPERPPAVDAAELEAKAELEAQLREVRLRKERECMVPSAGSALFEAYREYYSAPPSEDAKGRYSLLSLMEFGDEVPNREQRKWLMEFEQVAAYRKRAMAPRKANAEEEPPPEPPVHAEAHLRVADGGMSAWLFFLPPEHGGEELTAPSVKKQLAEFGIVYGVDSEKIEEACQRGRYLKLFQVAAGVLPTDGEDGEVLDHFKRGNDIELREKEDDTIDFKDLGWLQTVHAGEIICDVLPPVPPKDGVSVYGRAIGGRQGRKAVVPAGVGTRYDEDRQVLEAVLDGVLSFTGGRFQVEPLLVVHGDVDTAVGNLDVLGSVLVQGDIREGFEVRATVDITVRGMVEGAKLFAGGNIHVASGMNGAGNGCMEAAGDVKCIFIENANVTAGGTVFSETIMNSVVYSDANVHVLSGRGVIVGGSITAKKPHRCGIYW